MSTIRFELRRNANATAEAAIRLVYQISGQKKAFKTGQKVYPANWNQDEQRAIYVRKGKLSQSDIDEINRELAGQEKKIRDIEKRFELDSIQYDIDMVSDAIVNPQTKAGKASKELFAFIDEYITNNSSTRVKGSLSVYKSLKAHLQGYEKRNKTTISFAKIDHLFFQAFRNYLTGLTEEAPD